MLSQTIPLNWYKIISKPHKVKISTKSLVLFFFFKQYKQNMKNKNYIFIFKLLDLWNGDVLLVKCEAHKLHSHCQINFSIAIKLLLYIKYTLLPNDVDQIQPSNNIYNCICNCNCIMWIRKWGHVFNPIMLGGWP